MLTKTISKSVSKRLAVQKPKKRKTKTIRGLVEDAAVLLQKIRRIESADANGYCPCSSCGKVYHWTELQGGHYVPRTKTATKLEEHNINPLCASCNCFRAEEARCPYSIWMIETYGYPYVKWLEAESKKEKKWSRPELMELINSYRERLRALEG
jgi:hypothetical protein